MKQYSCLENPMGRGTWQAIVHGLTRIGHDLATKEREREMKLGSLVVPSQLRTLTFKSSNQNIMENNWKMMWKPTINDFWEISFKKKNTVCWEKFQREITFITHLTQVTFQMTNSFSHCFSLSLHPPQLAASLQTSLSYPKCPTTLSPT